MRRVHHFRWDVDKTYLQTDFDGVRALLRTFRQRADEKVTVPGATTLLRELLAPRADAVERKVMFISGSPRQMRSVLTEKLRLDGIAPDKFILKPNLSNLLLLRFKAVHSQVGYKLQALLRSMLRDGAVTESLFGDDSEQDAFIYSVYADLIAGRISLNTLSQILVKANVAARDRMTILEHAAMIPAVTEGRAHTVQRIYIHLDRRSPTVRFSPFGLRVVPVYNYFQAALVMYWDSHFEGRSLIRVIEAMSRSGYTPTRLANSVQDLVRRGYGDEGGVTRIADLLKSAEGVLPSTPAPIVGALARVLDGIPVYPPPSLAYQATPDYVELASDHKYVPSHPSFPILSFFRSSDEPAAT